VKVNLTEANGVSHPAMIVSNRLAGQVFSQYSQHPSGGRCGWGGWVGGGDRLLGCRSGAGLLNKPWRVLDAGRMRSVNRPGSH
jgi:hypothetical protein